MRYAFSNPEAGKRAGVDPGTRARLHLAIDAALARHPSQRLGQLISNATSRDDTFYLEDRDLCAALEKYARRPV